jgi:hypothetical protein
MPEDSCASCVSPVIKKAQTLLLEPSQNLIQLMDLMKLPVPKLFL